MERLRVYSIIMMDTPGGMCRGRAEGRTTRGPVLEASCSSWLTSSAVVSRLTEKTQSVRDALSSGTRTA